MIKVLAFDVYVGFDKAFVAIYIIGRAKTRELEKFAYKMGLIDANTVPSAEIAIFPKPSPYLRHYHRSIQ